MTTIIKEILFQNIKQLYFEIDAAGIYDALELGSSKMPSIDSLHDIDPMLSDDIEQPDDCHLFAICDVTVEEFELLCESKIQDSDNDTDDSEWEEAES